MKKNKKNRIALISFILFLILGVVLIVVGMVVEKKYTTIAITGTVLLAVSVLVFVSFMSLTKETEAKNVNIKKDATAICPHCGKENPGNIPYCTNCGCRLK